MKPISFLSDKRGFTLVEMLVSAAVLGIIMAMVAQVVNTAAQAIANSGKSFDTDDQARVIFGRMDSDFSRMLKRSDVDIIFAKQTGNLAAGVSPNDAIYFVTQSAGSNANTYYSSANANLLTLAGYGIAADPQGATINANLTSPLNDLVRLGHALTWDTYNSSPDNLVFVSFASPTNLIKSTTLDGHWSSIIGASPTYTPVTPANSDTNYGDYHAIGEQVFRFEYSFLLKDGTYSNVPVMTSKVPTNQTAGTAAPVATNDSTQSYSAGSRWFDSTDGRAFICVNPAKNNAVWAPLGVQDVSAIIVGMALLDRNVRKTISAASDYSGNGSSIAGLPGILTDYPTSTVLTPTTTVPTTSSPLLMQQAWQAIVDSPTTLQSNATAAGVSAALTKRIAGHIRVYQRYFYLNANNL